MIAIYAARYWKPLLASLALALLLGWGLRVNALRDHYRADLAAERTAHAQTKASYRAAQQASAEMEAARLSRVKGEQQRISENVSQDYARELDALRARYGRLRAQARTTGGASGGQPVPALPGASERTDGTANGDRFLDLLFAADENALKLVKLQGWVKDQTEVPVD